jgi:hypothetical protein
MGGIGREGDTGVSQISMKNLIKTVVVQNIIPNPNPI